MRPLIPPAFFPARLTADLAVNTVVREKKRFEMSLDDAVAQGLNAGVNILMRQVEHIITTHQGPTDYCPAEGVDMDLRPTKACREAIETLETHCNMLKGSTDKQILEVFHQEVGIRLHGYVLLLPLLQRTLADANAPGSSLSTSSASSSRSKAASSSSPTSTPTTPSSLTSGNPTSRPTLRASRWSARSS